MGLRGISKTMGVINRQKLPDIFSASVSTMNADSRRQTIGSGSNSGKETNINLIVKVGEKEVAGVVANAVAGEIKRMVYRDSLRG
jgi:hypothetical protein